MHPPCLAIEPNAGQTENLIQSIYELEKGAVAAPGFKMDSKHLDAWAREIKPRLEDTLRHKFRPHTGMDPSLALEFMMAGPSKTNLRPTIVIVCCNEPHRRQLRKIFKTQKWISEYKYRCMIVIDSFQKLANGIQLKQNTCVRVKLSKESPTLCGVLSELQSSDSREPVFFTLGGIILIRGNPYGITVRHVFDTTPIEEYSDSEESSAMDGDAEEDGSTFDSPFITFEESDESSLNENHNPLCDLCPAVQNAAPSVTDEPPTIHGHELMTRPPEWTQVGSIYNVGKDTVSRVSSSTSKLSTRQSSDWALVEIENSDHWLVNAVSVPGRRLTIQVDSVLEESNIVHGWVWINAGISGMMRGLLSEITVHLRLGNIIVNARQIILDRALGKLPLAQLGFAVPGLTGHSSWRLWRMGNSAWQGLWSCYRWSQGCSMGIYDTDGTNLARNHV
jgi:hypothetical protein